MEVVDGEASPQTCKQYSKEGRMYGLWSSRRLDGQKENVARKRFPDMGPNPDPAVGVSNQTRNEAVVCYVGRCLVRSPEIFPN